MDEEENDPAESVASSGEQPSEDDELEEEELEELSEEEVKSKLVAALENVHETAFSTSTFVTVPNFVNPELVVNCCGPISLPLNDVDARRTIAVSHHALFGKSEETIIDISVRCTWELNREQLTVQNAESFKQVEGRALQAVCDKLGLQHVRQTIRAEPYKLLLYEKGAMFKPHTT